VLLEEKAATANSRSKE